MQAFTPNREQKASLLTTEQELKTEGQIELLAQRTAEEKNVAQKQILARQIIAECNRFLFTDPSHAKLYIYRAFAYQQLGNQRQATADFVQACEWSSVLFDQSNLPVWLRINLGRVANEVERYVQLLKQASGQPGYNIEQIMPAFRQLFRHIAETCPGPGCPEKIYYFPLLRITSVYTESGPHFLFGIVSPSDIQPSLLQPHPVSQYTEMLAALSSGQAAALLFGQARPPSCAATAAQKSEQKTAPAVVVPVTVTTGTLSCKAPTASKKQAPAKRESKTTHDEQPPSKIEVAPVVLPTVEEIWEQIEKHLSYIRDSKKHKQPKFYETLGTNGTLRDIRAARFPVPDLGKLIGFERKLQTIVDKIQRNVEHVVALTVTNRAPVALVSSRSSLQPTSEKKSYHKQEKKCAMQKGVVSAKADAKNITTSNRSSKITVVLKGRFATSPALRDTKDFKQTAAERKADLDALVEAGSRLPYYLGLVR